jgi:hypothetical protein
MLRQPLFAGANLPGFDLLAADVLHRILAGLVAQVDANGQPFFRLLAGLVLFPAFIPAILFHGWSPPGAQRPWSLHLEA